jgi:2-polyprenyl-3-methyl-5-hydroxy-6-metoxy-1,4-benzoquinol methylase
MNCYLCEATSFSTRKGEVRDNPSLQIIECNNCGLVFLSDDSHIKKDFYANSGMHGEKPISMEAWLKETEWDDLRRYKMLRSALPNQTLLDFGCGAGGFLSMASSLTETATGIELEARVINHWKGKINIVKNIDGVGGGYDLITAFHVMEHLSDPLKILKALAKKLSASGQMVIEIPSSEDALLTLYGCEAFQHFTYWSQHLFLFNANTLEMLARKAGLKVLAIQHVQRYPLSNHLHWLSKGKAGGHKYWGFLDSPEMANAYANTLASLGKTDTLIAYLELCN